MTRKDYGLIADALKESKLECSEAYEDQWNTTTQAVADALQTENPRFDRGRFLEACGVED